MAKEVAGLIKLQIKGGAANPSPPVGPALVNRALAFKKNDACNFVKEVCSFPRAYVLLKGKE